MTGLRHKRRFTGLASRQSLKLGHPVTGLRLLGAKPDLNVSGSKTWSSSNRIKTPVPFLWFKGQYGLKLGHPVTGLRPKSVLLHAQSIPGPKLGHPVTGLRPNIIAIVDICRQSKTWLSSDRTKTVASGEHLHRLI